MAKSDRRIETTNQLFSGTKYHVAGDPACQSFTTREAAEARAEALDNGQAIADAYCDVDTRFGR